MSPEPISNDDITPRLKPAPHQSRVSGCSFLTFIVETIPLVNILRDTVKLTLKEILGPQFGKLFFVNFCFISSVFW